MAEIYDLLPLVTSFTMSDYMTSTPLSTWEVSGSVLQTVAPVTVTRPSTTASWRPGPWLRGGIIDLTGLAEVGDNARIRYSGTITKTPSIVQVRSVDVYTEVVDEGDHYSFSSEWSNPQEVFDPAVFTPILAFSFYGPVGSGGLSLSNVEAQVSYEIEISEPPPPPPLTVEAQWNNSALSSGGTCTYSIDRITDVTVLSATLSTYEASDTFSDIGGTCFGGVDIQWSGLPVATYDVDVNTVNMQILEGTTLSLTGFTHEAMVDGTNLKLVLQLSITVDGTPYTVNVVGYRNAWYG